MDFDDEILQRLSNTEDHFTERKAAPHRDDCIEPIIAFANSALPNKPGILYVGVDNAGNILDNVGIESWQIKIGKWANSCFPEITPILRAMNMNEKPFLAVVVPLSPLRPHFAAPTFKRVAGPSTVPASQNEIDEWIAYRNSKVRYILDRKNQTVTLQPLIMGTGLSNAWGNPGTYRVLDCNEHWVTLINSGSDRIVTHPLTYIDLKMNDGKPNPPGQLLLLLKPY